MLFQGFRSITLILVLITFVGCGMSESFDRSLPYNSRIKVNHKRLQIVEQQLILINERLDVLEGRVDTAEQTMFDNKINIDRLEALIVVNKEMADSLKILLDSQITNTDTALAALEDDYNAKITQVNDKFDLILDSVALELIEIRNSIVDQEVEAVYPCNNAQEVLLNTSIGLIAYFQSGNNRYLSILNDGVYKTTDSVGCTFTVSDGEIL